MQTIARYEPVRVLASRGQSLREARREFALCPNVAVIEAPIDDFWMRDIAPTFALRGSGHHQEVIAIDWNFNGWGGTRERPPRAGDSLAKIATAIFGVPRIPALFVGEGGALITDGRGTLITTRSCLLNPNRNRVRRGINRQRMIEAELGRFGIRHVVWLEKATRASRSPADIRSESRLIGRIKYSNNSGKFGHMPKKHRYRWHSHFWLCAATWSARGFPVLTGGRPTPRGIGGTAIAFQRSS